MNIQMQCCGLLMLLILSIVLLREKSLDLDRRRKFKDTMLSCIVCLVADIVSVVMITYASEGRIPDIVALIVCKIYLVFLISVGYRGFLYTAGEFFNESTHNTLRNIYRTIFIIGIFAILILPINYYCEGRIVYSFGPSPMATYSLAFIMLVSTTVMAFVGGKATSRRRKRVIILWQFSWIVSAFIQFMRPDLLVVSFAAAFGIVLVYAELENPNEGTDRVTGQFTANALYLYLTDLYRRGETFSAMHITVDYGAADFDLELETTAMRRIADFLDSNSGTYVFRESDRDFIIIYKNREDMQADYERAVSGLEAAVGLPVKAAYTLIPDSGVLENADEFMQFQHYNVRKIDASNCTIAGAELTQDMRDYLRIRDQINRALANDAIEVYYQPIYNIEEKRFTSAEALMRIRDSEGNLVMPGRFIPIAEENGLIVPLSREVIRQVCDFLAKGEVQKLGIEYIEINLSMAQFRENEPANFVRRTIVQSGIDPRWINLEITETADSSARQVILNNMQSLIDTGVSFSLDDFGTGRSNLDYFVAMPVSMIKFDRSFTHMYMVDENSRDVIGGIVDIITGRGLPIVMEGVETKEELDTMIKLGASFIQGYYFSKPLPEKEFIQFLKDNKNGPIGHEQTDHLEG